ncbi:hypothetical protein SeLEV6574_g08349, partial [Synchytrium endobioticum]
MAILSWLTRPQQPGKEKLWKTLRLRKETAKKNQSASASSIGHQRIQPVEGLILLSASVAYPRLALLSNHQCAVSKSLSAARHLRRTFDSEKCERAGPDGRLQRRQALPKCESAIAPPAASGGFTFEKLGTEYKTWQNLARTDPQGFIKSVAAGGKIPLSGEALAFMQKQAPLGALVLKDGLQQCALAIVLDEGPAGLFGHTDSKGRDITARMGRF